VSRQVALASGSGRSLSVAPTITPIVPSEPTRSLGTSYPVTDLTTLAPPHVIVPSAWTKRTPSVRSRAVPWRRRNGPLALVARTPPIVRVAPPMGSMGSSWFFPPSVRARAESLTPASTLTTMSSATYSVTASSRLRSTTRSRRRGGFPRPTAAPLPRGDTASLSAWASAKRRLTSSTRPGLAIQRGRMPSTACASSAPGASIR
jgi:hypothetical protein